MRASPSSTHPDKQILTRTKKMSAAAAASAANRDEKSVVAITKQPYVRTQVSIEPKIWGHLFWLVLVYLTRILILERKYRKRNGKDWELLILLLPFVLPCNKCRKHCSRFITKHPPSAQQPLTWLFALYSRIKRRTQKNIKSLKTMSAAEIKRLFQEWCSQLFQELDAKTPLQMSGLLNRVLQFVDEAAKGNQQGGTTFANQFHELVNKIVALSPVSAL